MAILSDSEIAAKLTALVRSRELTREAIVGMSASSGVSGRHIRAWLNGKSITRVPKLLRTLCENLDELIRRLRLRNWIGPSLKLGAVGLWITEMWQDLGWHTTYTFKRDEKDQRCIITAKHPSKNISVSQDVAPTDLPGIYLITTVYPQGAVLSCFLNCKNPLLGAQVLQDYFFNIKGDADGRRRIYRVGTSGSAATRAHLERAGAVEICKWRDSPSAVDRRVTRGAKPSGGPR